MSRVLTVSLALMVLVGCGDDGGGPSDGAVGDGATMDGAAGDGAAGDGAAGDGTVTGDGAAGDGGDGRCRPVMCQSMTRACADCMDNDGDGLTDAEDPDCLGPCDNNEEGFDLRIPGGDSAPCHLDCYYDHDEGPGNDGCQWDARCDPKEPDPLPRCRYADPPPPDATCPDPQSAMCHEVCSPLTPNGCDCFGCCTFDALSGRPEGRGGEYVFIGSVDGAGNPTCTLDDVEDVGLCHPCTPVDDCLNECGHCELCIGRTELPPDCYERPDAGPGYDGGPGFDGGTPTYDGGVPPEERCPGGEQPCGLPGDPACPTDYFCVTGCCQYFG